MTCRTALALTVACVLIACGSVLIAGAGPGVAGAERPDAGQPATSTELQEPPDADATVTRIRVFANGTAEWSLTIRMQLDSEAEEEEFAAFRAEFADNRSMFLSDYRQPRVNAVSDAANLTGREMRATRFTAETGTEGVVRQRGFVTYQFRWEGFASVENQTVSAGDVFESGLFLEENGILVMESPDGYESATVTPEPEETGAGELQWTGPTEFGDRQPSAQFVPEGPDNGSDDSTDGGSTVAADEAPADGGSGDGGLSTGSVVFGTASIAALVGVTAFYLHRRRQEPDTDETSTASGSETSAPETTDESGASTTSDGVPDLATDEDRVLAELEDAGGRMRQSELADQLDWSPSKTSRVLSDMSDGGQVEKLRIGRENVIDLVETDEE